jgi:hypothetical protein
MCNSNNLPKEIRSLEETLVLFIMAVFGLPWRKKDLIQRIDYIHNNPVEAGIVLSPEEYLYGRALNYARKPEALDVMLV